MSSIERRFKKMKPMLLAAMRRDDADFYFSIVPDKAMEDLRKELIRRPDFKGREAEKIKKEAMVNVLSFEHPKGFPSPVRGKVYLGEVYLNKDFGGGKAEVLGPLFIHGFLHLLGYRHWTKRDTIRMKKEEKKLEKCLHILLSASTSAHRPSKRPSRRSRETA